MSKEGEQRLTVVSFSGKQGDWTTWEEKFLARANMKGYKEVLLMEPSAIPNKLSDSTTVLNKSLNHKNNAAYSDLILSMNTESPAGKVAFTLIRSTKSDDYPNGNAAEAFKRLINKYKPKTAIVE